MQLNESHHPHIIHLHRMRAYYDLDMKVFDASMVVLRYMHQYNVQSEFIIKGINHVDIVFESLDYQLNIRSERRVIIGDGFGNTAVFINEINMLKIINRIKFLSSRNNDNE